MASLAWDNPGRRNAIAFLGGAAAAYGYDASSRLTSLTHNLVGTGNDVMFGFGYNPAGQIVSQARSNDLYAFAHANGSAG